MIRPDKCSNTDFVVRIPTLDFHLDFGLVDFGFPTMELDFTPNKYAFT